MQGSDILNSTWFWGGVILSLAFILLAAWAFFETLRFNLHMLQLNGYDNEEHAHWLKNNRGKQRQLIFLLICAVMMGIYSAPVTAVISILFLILENNFVCCIRI